MAPEHHQPEHHHPEHGTESVGVVDVQVLADLAHLPLPGGRPAAVARVLSSWMPPLLALADAMSAPEHAEVIPITVVAHPGATGDTE